MQGCASTAMWPCWYGHRYIHACMYACIPTYMHACMHACVRSMRPHACVHTCHTCIQFMSAVILAVCQFQGFECNFVPGENIVRSNHPVSFPPSSLSGGNSPLVRALWKGLSPKSNSPRAKKTGALMLRALRPSFVCLVSLGVCVCECVCVCAGCKQESRDKT